MLVQKILSQNPYFIEKVIVITCKLLVLGSELTNDLYIGSQCLGIVSLHLLLDFDHVEIVLERNSGL